MKNTPYAAPSVKQMIDGLRNGNAESLGNLLQLYRRLRRRMSASDLVQETMLAAHRDFAQFRGNSEGELMAWLRQILGNCLSHAIEKNVDAKKRQRSLVNRFSINLVCWKTILAIPNLQPKSC